MRQFSDYYDWLVRQLGLVNVLEFDADPTGGSSTATKAAIQAAVDKASEKRTGVFLPPGDFSVDGTITSTERISFVGAGDKSVIRPTAGNFDVLHFKYDSGGGRGPCNEIKNFKIIGPSDFPSGNARGILIDNLPLTVVSGVRISKVAIGIDLINNCYETSFYNCVASDGVNLGMNLRTGTQSGNDLLLSNCWFAGRDGAISLSPGFSGLTIVGGQLAGGNGLSAANDEFGVISIGKDYLSGTIGSAGRISITGVDFEQVRYMWTIRAHGLCSVSLDGGAVLANGVDDQTLVPIPAIGFYKNSDYQNSNFEFGNFLMGGEFTNSKFIEVSGVSSSQAGMLEKTPPIISSSLKINGATVSITKGLLRQSGITTLNSLIGRETTTTNSNARRVTLFCKNATGSTIPKNRLVSFAGLDGAFTNKVELTTTTNQEWMMGVTLTDILDGEVGQVVIKGVADLQTETGAATLKKYAKASSTAGVSTSGDTTAPPGQVKIAFCETVNGSQGYDPRVTVN